jgi:leucyl-tRNA synthetase
MKDWAFNRQRYWGEPIPIVHCEHCGMVPLPEEELPLRLPAVQNFEPGEGGESPLAKIPEFVNCKCPVCGKDAKRETDTMPQWAGSSWYFLRYCDPKNDKALASKEALEYWMPVDWYNGGMEHVTRHMIYSRFWHKFLYDMGEVNTEEPYAKRTAQGLILGPDGEKMSKSRGNVVDPNEVVDVYGADVLRTYILFMGDYGAAAPWNENSIKGCKRFLDRVEGLLSIAKGEGVTPELESLFHKTVKKVTLDIEEMKFNTAIAAMMSLLNEIYNKGTITKDEVKTLVLLL